MSVWVDMRHLCNGWIVSRCDAKLDKKFDAQFTSRLKTLSYESACWGALAACGLKQESEHLKSLVRECQCREMPDGRLEIYMGQIRKPLREPSKRA